MLIIEQAKLAFLAAPKSGSVTVVRLLASYCRDNGLRWVTHRDFGLSEHMTRRRIEERLGEVGYPKDDLTYFTIIRNPWNRCRSFFEFALFDKHNLAWWQEGYDPEPGLLTQDEWMNTDEVSWGTFKRWSTTYRFQSYALPPENGAETSFFRIENDLERLAQFVDARQPGFLEYFINAPQKKDNEGLLMYMRAHNEEPKETVKFDMNDEAIARIADMWAVDIAMGGYSPPSPSSASE